MFRLGIIAFLLCSQLAAPALSGRFVCLAANGCICLDGGPETCTCCRIREKAPTCGCGCHHEDTVPMTELAGGREDCSHIAIGDYETSVGQSRLSLEILSLPLPGELAVCSPLPTASLLARGSSLPDDSANLAVIATVVLRI